MRSFPGGRRGIRVGSHWYCSVDCFVQAAGATLFALSNRRVVEMPRIPRLSLGLLMISRGYMTAEQLRVASEQSRWRGEDLEITLIQLGMVTEKQLAAARSAQWGYPVLAQEHIGRIVQSDIPPSILQSCAAVPLHYSPAAKRVLIGFVYRIEHSLLKSVEQMTGCRVEPCFITASDLAEQSERLTQVPGYREVIVEEPGSPEKMAHALGRAAVEISAEKAEFTLCADNIWARLAGKRGFTDVVYRLQRAWAAQGWTQVGYFSEPVSSTG